MYVITDAKVITNITAIPIRLQYQFSLILEKGHVPKNCMNIILLTINDVINKPTNSIPTSKLSF